MLSPARSSNPANDEGPFYYEFTVQRGASQEIGVLLATQDIFTERVKIKKLAEGEVIRWVIVNADGSITQKTNMDSDLDFYPENCALIWKMTPDFTLSLPSGAPLRTLILTATSAGAIDIWLDGYIVPRG